MREPSLACAGFSWTVTLYPTSFLASQRRRWLEEVSGLSRGLT